MKTEKQPKSAFTLVEMLVVIAIISLVAMAISHAVRGAQRTANAAKCQANLKNLHTAVVAYFADKGHYPLASSYETMKMVPDDKGSGKIIEYHSEHVGWVSWVPKSKNKKRRNSNGKTPWQEKRTTSHAEDFYFPSNFDAKMKEAIEEGSLYKYVGKDPSSFLCPQHRFSSDGKHIHLSYAMNSWFFSHSWLHIRWERRVEGNPADYARETKDFTSRTQAIPSRMALFIEMEDADDDKPDGREGQSADSLQHAKIIKGDCVWEWWEKIGLEKGRYNFKNKADGHFKGATKYSNVVFVDGHVAAIPYEVEDSSDKTEWNNHKDLDEVFTTLGKGSY